MTTEATDLRAIADVTDDEIVCVIGLFGVNGMCCSLGHEHVTHLCRELRVVKSSHHLLFMRILTLATQPSPRITSTGNWYRLSSSEWARKIAVCCGLAMPSDVNAIADMLTSKY